MISKRSLPAATLFVFLLVACCEGIAGEQSHFDHAVDRQIKALAQNIGRPQALLHLYFLCELVEYAQEYDKIYGAVSTILTEPKASMLLKSEALYKLSLLDARRGDLTAARKKQSQLGLMTDWLIIGPFDNEGKSGFDVAYPPEEKIDLAAEYPGKEHTVQWRRLPAVTVNGYIPLDTIFHPNTDAVAYALVWLHSPDSREVALRFGSDDAVKIWLNDQLIYENSDHHSAAFDQAAAGARLNKG